MIDNAIKAKDDFLRAAAIKPEVVECRFLLAQVFAKLNQPDSVEYWLKRAAVDRGTKRLRLLLHQAPTLARSPTTLPLAIVYLKKAVESNPKRGIIL